MDVRAVRRARAEPRRALYQARHHPGGADVPRSRGRLVQVRTAHDGAAPHDVGTAADADAAAAATPDAAAAADAQGV